MSVGGQMIGMNQGGGLPQAVGAMSGRAPQLSGGGMDQLMAQLRQLGFIG
jgi:hypothetical protein